MIKNNKILEKLIKEEMKKEKLSYLDNLKIFEYMWEEAKTLGAIPLKDYMDEIETDIRIAKILNSCSKI